MLRRRQADLAVLAGYLAVSFACFGWRVLPHPGRLLAGGTDSRDPDFFIWSFAWWPHAIAHWTNPFVAHVIYAPTGVNLTWTATSPGLALAASPLTVLFGPAVAYNVVALLLPALAAWTAYLLCRHLAASLWPSVAGGFLFGFSSEVLQEELWGNLDMTSVFLLPLVALVVVRYVQRELDARGLAWRLGVLLAAQLWLSTEHALTATLALLLGLGLAYVFVRDARPRLRSSLAPIAAAYALAALLAGPFTVYAVIGIPPSGFAPSLVGADLLDLVVPEAHTIAGSAFTSISSRFIGAGAYLGLPTLVIVGWFFLRGRRPDVRRFLVAVFLVCVLITLGTTLYVAGRDVMPLPWRAPSRLPILEDVFPFRFAIFPALAAAVIVALWTAGGRRRIVLPALAVAALVPAVWQTSYARVARWHPERPAFFADKLYERCLARGETVTIFPFGQYDDALLYQGESDFWFRMAEDWLQPLPKEGERAWASFDDDWIVRQLNGSGRLTTNTMLAFAGIHRIDRFVVLDGADFPTAADLRRLGPTQSIGGALVSPACGRPSLRERDLSGAVRTYAQQRRADAHIAYCLGPNTVELDAGTLPSGDLAAATRARFVAGRGLTCEAPPAGYRRQGFATANMNVPPGTYALYVP